MRVNHCEVDEVVSAQRHSFKCFQTKRSELLEQTENFLTKKVKIGIEESEIIVTLIVVQ